MGERDATAEKQAKVLTRIRQLIRELADKRGKGKSN
jgi:hypothetical protein